MAKCQSWYCEERGRRLDARRTRSVGSERPLVHQCAYRRSHIETRVVFIWGTWGVLWGAGVEVRGTLCRHRSCCRCLHLHLVACHGWGSRSSISIGRNIRLEGNVFPARPHDSSSNAPINILMFFDLLLMAGYILRISLSDAQQAFAMIVLQATVTSPTYRSLPVNFLTAGGRFYK